MLSFSELSKPLIDIELYGNIRFGGRRLSLPVPVSPTEIINSAEMTYISALLAAYSEAVINV